MTAEIAVMNKNGIALAADSAASSLTTQGYKIRNAEKLFRLLDGAPVAVMIYGSSAFMGIPWETMLQLYRKAHPATTFPTLAEYGESFLTFLRSKASIIPKEEREMYVFRVVAARSGLIIRKIAETMQKTGKTRDAVSSKEIGSFASLVSKLTKFKGLPKGFESQFNTLYSATINEAIKQFFKESPLAPALQKKLAATFAKLFSSELLTDVSGVVVAGYGDDQIFPSLVAYDIEGIPMDGILRYLKTRDDSISFDTSASITPFAQGEMVATFMEGIHPMMEHFFHICVREVLDKYGKAVIALPQLKGKEKKVAGALSAHSAQILKDCFDKISKHKHTGHVSKITRALSGLPKEELGIMAETLVNLTSFKRRVSTDAETVGGPIDVAVISKSDGLVWIKRKRYFTAELNPCP